MSHKIQQTEDNTTTLIASLAKGNETAFPERNLIVKDSAYNVSSSYFHTSNRYLTIRPWTEVFSL